MTPEQFIARWRGNTRTERAAAQQHFLELCDLLGVDRPSGNPDYEFEKSLRKIGDTQGFADVWKRGCFAWEYKGDRKNLKTRTLTNLYNERPAWLANAHRDLDAAVAAAYGWPADISEEDALARLLALNLERAAQGR